MKKRAVPLSLLALATAAVILAAWQGDNLKALYLYKTASSDELAQSEAEQKKKQQDVFSGYDLTVRDLTPEEENDLITGKLTPSEVVEAITKTDEPGVQQSVAPAAAASEKSVPVGESADTIVNGYLTKIYSLKAEYLGKLGGLYSAARDEYHALPEEEQTPQKKSSIAMGYAIDAAEYEYECDSQIDVLLSRMGTELKKAGGDNSITGQIRTAYKNEKAAKKAYYLSLLQG